jgi:hypothetical protein
VTFFDKRQRNSRKKTFLKAKPLLLFQGQWLARRSAIAFKHVKSVSGTFLGASETAAQNPFVRQVLKDTSGFAFKFPLIAPSIAVLAGHCRAKTRARQDAEAFIVRPWMACR